MDANGHRIRWLEWLGRGLIVLALGLFAVSAYGWYQDYLDRDPALPFTIHEPFREMKVPAGEKGVIEFAIHNHGRRRIRVVGAGFT